MLSNQKKNLDFTHLKTIYLLKKKSNPHPLWQNLLNKTSCTNKKIKFMQNLHKEIDTRDPIAYESKAEQNAFFNW